MAEFNDDMKLMVLNSYQMSDLAGYLQKENDLIVEWMSEMQKETKVIKNEKMIKIDRLLNASLEEKPERKKSYESRNFHR